MDGALTLDDLADAQLTSQVPADVAQAVRKGQPYRELPAYRAGVLSAAATRALGRYERVRNLIDNLSPQRIMEQTPRSPAIVGKARQPAAAESVYRREALAAVLAVATAAHPSPARPPALKMEDVAPALLQRLQPVHSIIPALLARLQLRQGGPGTTQRLDPVLAHTTFFSVPTYELLQEFSLERMVPGIGAVKQNSVALMETNPTFIEVFLAALNHEMGAELLWRGFRTDRRGSYFRRFWDRVDALGAALPDIRELHTWSKGLGEHGEGDAQGPNPVLLIRGDLLWKYPNTLIYAVKAHLQANWRPKLPKVRDPILPVFRGNLGGDVVYLCFPIELEKQHSRDPGHFFAFQEPSFERFGADAPGTASASTGDWNDLRWDNEWVGEGSYLRVDDPPDLQPVSGPAWGESAAAFAQILYQRPVCVYVHQSELLPRE
jgi:hypothetical protein